MTQPDAKVKNLPLPPAHIPLKIHRRPGNPSEVGHQGRRV
jgi:hypothetical protein